MHETAKQLFNLMFRPGETVCVSSNKYGYHSIPLENAINGPVTLVPPNDKMEWVHPDTKDLTLVALNPIKGFRQDLNCIAFRNFLVEMDYGPLAEQLAYIKRIGLPYSAIVFSGNKSLHVLVSLDTDLPSETVYRIFSEWILAIVSLADQNTQNPSRSIRIPGALREPGKRQAMVESEYKGPVKIQDLVAWLNKYPNSRPVERQKNVISEVPFFEGIPDWICEKLYAGIYPPNRNKQWFTVAVAFCLSGQSEDDTIDVLRPYFTPDRDFKEKEWITTIESAFKWSYERKR